jgi:hypothetical protein
LHYSAGFKRGPTGAKTWQVFSNAHGFLDSPNLSFKGFVSPVNKAEYGGSMDGILTEMDVSGLKTHIQSFSEMW